MQQNNADNFVVVNTKVSKPAAALLQQLALTKGISIYELLQMVLDTLIRYMSEDHNLSAEMEKAMSIFEHMHGWQNAFNLCDPNAEQEISEATYYLVGKNKNGARAVHVNRPYFGDWEETENIQTILERTICLLAPERYRRLRALAVDMDCKSLLEMLDELIDTHSSDADVAEYRKTFEDVNRSEYGRPIEYGKKFARKHSRSLNNQPTMFNDNEEE